MELLRKPDEEDWRVSLIDTGMWRNIGERLWAVRDHVKDEEIFLANYSDGLMQCRPQRYAAIASRKAAS